MRLLLDENLSESVLLAIAACIPSHSMFACLVPEEPQMIMVWRMAKEHGCVLVTRDEDFLRLSIVRGAPPKVVWLAVGNCSNQEVISLLRTRRQNIQEFCGHEQATFLTLGF